MGRSSYRRIAFVVAFVSFALTSTVTAWASKCDDCAKKMSCCESDRAPVQPGILTATIAPTIPPCCQTTTVGHCDGARYDHGDAVAPTGGVDMAVLATTPYVGLAADVATTSAPTFVPHAVAAAPPPRTVILLI